MQTVSDRLNTLPQRGRLDWIGLSISSELPLQEVTVATLLTGHGLEGDRHAKHRAGAARQVTLIQREHLAAIASMAQVAEVTPARLRRNLVVSGINLLALKGREFWIGDCRLAYSGPCDPCSRMEATLGPGGLNAMRGHGGITARVLQGGQIRLGDAVRLAEKELASEQNSTQGSLFPETDVKQ